MVEKNWIKRHPVWSGVIGIVVLFILIGIFSGGDNTSNTQTTTSNQNNNQEDLSSQSLERIDQIVNNVGDYEVTIWDSSGNFATETSTPYEIIVNTQPNTFSDCFDAKNSLYGVMKGLYTDEVLNDKIARVQFTAWGYLKSSLGSDDAGELKWNDFGPSNFWTVNLQFKDYEDTSGPMSQRTWGVKIDESCD